MKRDFNFENIGKRMPYSTPEGFFDELEENIVGAAAAAALLVAVNLNLYKADAATSADIEEAFSQLSADDQEFMLSVYQDDVFFNE